MTEDFHAGDTLSYRSVTQGHLVIWTRDDGGEWHANDENWTARGSATDSDVRFAMKSDDAIYTPGGPVSDSPEIVSVAMHAVLLPDFEAWLNSRGLELARMAFADEPDLKHYSVIPGEDLMRAVRDG